MELEVVELEPSQRCCRRCGKEYGGGAGSEQSQTLEIEVRAYRRVIRRPRYRRSCECGSEPRTITAAPAPRLIRGGMLGISVWVTTLLDKYLLQATDLSVAGGSARPRAGSGPGNGDRRPAVLGAAVHAAVRGTDRAQPLGGALAR